MYYKAYVNSLEHTHYIYISIDIYTYFKFKFYLLSFQVFSETLEEISAACIKEAGFTGDLDKLGMQYISLLLKYETKTMKLDLKYLFDVSDYSDPAFPKEAKVCYIFLFEILS